jgi:hypothetical protein
MLDENDAGLNDKRMGHKSRDARAKKKKEKEARKATGARETERKNK